MLLYRDDALANIKDAALGGIRHLPIVVIGVIVILGSCHPKTFANDMNRSETCTRSLLQR